MYVIRLTRSTSFKSCLIQPKSNVGIIGIIFLKLLFEIYLFVYIFYSEVIKLPFKILFFCFYWFKNILHLFYCKHL